jgi:hypothetical protein
VLLKEQGDFRCTQLIPLDSEIRGALMMAQDILSNYTAEVLTLIP